MSLLKNLMVDTKSAWIEYPGMHGFEVEIANLSRPQLIKLRKGCMISKFDKRTRQVEETLDEAKFISKFTEATVKNWRGFRYEYLEQLLLVNIDSENPDAELPYSKEDAEELVKNSSDFDTWLNEAVFDLDNFRTEREGKSVGTPGEVA